MTIFPKPVVQSKKVAFSITEELCIQVKGTLMAKQKKLRVQADGYRRYISVPAGRAIELHNYLRSNRVHSAPPEPAFTGIDFIELANDIDVGGVQALLNTWT